MFWAKKSYFLRIFDLRHFRGPDDNLYHPTGEMPGNRLKTAKSGMAQKNRPHFATGPVYCFVFNYEKIM